MGSCDWGFAFEAMKALRKGEIEIMERKITYKDMPESMRGTYGEFSKNFGFDWKEFVMGIPTPIIEENCEAGILEETREIR